MRKRWVGLAALVGGCALLFLGCTQPGATVSLTVEFAVMGGYAGHRFEIRVLAAGGVEVDRQAIASVSSTQFDVTFPGLEAGKDYRLDFYVDLNDNGQYDAPPTDHAWRIEVPGTEEDVTLPFTPGGPFTDISWPGTPPTEPVADGRIGAGEYRHTITDPTTAMSVWWENDATTLYVGLAAPGRGWLAIGFDPEDKMDGANIIIGYVSDGALTIDDQYGSGTNNHASDAHDDIVTSGGREVGGTTTMEFSIPMDSRDPFDKRLEPGERYAILLAYHKTEDVLSMYHAAQRSTTHITLD